MKTSMFLVATGAVMALATPLDKRTFVETDVVVEYYTVTVTADGSESTTSASQPTVFVNGGKHKSEPAQTSSSTVVEVPTSTTAPAVVYVTQTNTYGAEPAPSSTAETTAQAVETTTEAAQEYSTEAPATSTTPASTYVAVPASTSSEAATASPSDMPSTALYAHNLHRANHSAPSMTWLDEIATYAETTANTCTFAHDMDQGSGNYGQNIAMWATSDNAAALGAAGAIGMASHDMWYNGEIGKFLPSYYGESTPDMTDFEAWGHFSQLVWKDSTELGCYAKLCAAGTMYTDMDAWYMVCNYRPAGNVGGGYGTNVLSPLGEATVTN
ncbi:putative CAP domain-containing protein [Seiridium cardinale]|uniref:CAP domain-containing protein n=1 Tax=Seiridium cardinale TaxID=138064 RepID=A0ABR2XDA5_9PEZI